MSKSKNDNAWEKLFDKHNIINKVRQEGFITIEAANINLFREARLMTKFDHRSQLPQIFADNKLAILPVNRGSYVIGTFDIFQNFNTNESEVLKLNFPNHLQSLDFKNINSEAAAINCAFVSNILTDFSRENILYPTVNGRMGSSVFNFDINDSNGLFNIKVENSQIEIDGGFEGANGLYLIEAKNYISDDFLVRQLYYPFRLWESKINKKVKPIFLSYSNGIFHLREYAFADTRHYNSAQLIRQKKYFLQQGIIKQETIFELVKNAKVLAEPAIPFPQANSFERVINLCELLYQKEVLTKEEITGNYDFDIRQTDYYTNAAKYLGIVDTYLGNGNVNCFLTKKGKKLFDLSIIDRQLAFVSLILEHEVFAKVLTKYFEIGAIPNKDNIVELMKTSNLYKVDSASTFYRRASTINKWCGWVINLIEEYRLF